jgi:hypothetical protein
MLSFCMISSWCRTWKTSEEVPLKAGSSTFPQPSIREFVMRVRTARPAPSSRLTPQRLTAVLKKEEFRLAGCFCHDTTFQ